MNQLSINNLKIINQISEPYPIIIYSNLLNDNQLDNLKRCLSKEDTIFDKTVMGNRKTILKGTKNFEDFVKNHEIGKNINNFFEDISVFNFFYENLQKLNKKSFQYFDFQNKNFKFLKNYISRNRTISFRLKNRISKILSKLNNDCGVYCDFDFSVAGNGYEREPHHDVEGRIVNFLLYINNFDGKNGGNFQIYKYKRNPNQYIRQPSLNDVEIFNEIEPQRGYLVTFLSSPNSLHGVDTISSNNEKRYFFYGSYTSITTFDWKINKSL